MTKDIIKPHNEKIKLWKQLHLEATGLKDEYFDKAIDKLKEANLLNFEIENAGLQDRNLVTVGISRMDRLVKFLNKAGRKHEALIEEDIIKTHDRNFHKELIRQKWEKAKRTKKLIPYVKIYLGEVREGENTCPYHTKYKNHAFLIKDELWGTLISIFWCDDNCRCSFGTIIKDQVIETKKIIVE